MYTVFIYNDETNRLERYKLKPYHDMPYTYNNTLPVSVFFANTASSVGWSSTEFLRLWAAFSKEGCSGHYFFRRISEGGHIQQSMHYAGIAAKISESSGATFPFCDRKHVSLLPAGYPNLFPGDIGHFVFVMQDALISLGFDKCSLDGFFGPRTKEALLSFKNTCHLPATPFFDSDTIDRLTFFAAGSGANNTFNM